MMEPITQEDFGRIHGSLLQFMTPCHLAEAVANLGDRTRAEWLLEPLTPLTDRMISFNTGQMFSGWVGLPVGRLLGVVGRFEEAEARLIEARTKALRLGSSIFEQRADVAILELDHRAGRRPRSSPTAARKRAIGDGFQGIANRAERLI